MALEVQYRDVLCGCDVSDLLQRLRIQIHKAARINDLKPPKLSRHAVKHCAVEREISTFIGRGVAMIIAKGASLPLTSRTAQQHDLPWIFLGDLVVSVHFK